MSETFEEKTQKIVQRHADIVNAYRDILIEIRARLGILANIMQGNSSIPFEAANIEFCALNLRKIVELMTFSVAMANRERLEQLHKDVKTKKASEMFKILNKINPQWYPVPRTPTIRDGEAELPKANQPYLQKSEWIAVYDLSSVLIHAGNPMRKPIDPLSYKDKIFEYTKKLANLFEVHTLWVAGQGCGVMLLACSHLDDDQRDSDGLPEVALLTADCEDDKVEFID